MGPDVLRFSDSVLEGRCLEKTVILSMTCVKSDSVDLTFHSPSRLEVEQIPLNLAGLLLDIVLRFVDVLEAGDIRHRQPPLQKGFGILDIGHSFTLLVSIFN